MIRGGLSDLSIEAQPVSRDQELKASLECLLGIPVWITGTFDFQGKIAARNNLENLASSFQGNFAFGAKGGRIYRESMLIKILTLLNLFEVLGGEKADWEKEGVSYKSLKAKGRVQGHKLVIDELIMDAPWMQMVSQGEVDLLSHKVDLIVILSPLRTLDRIISHIPIVAEIFDRKLVAIPARVRGELENPKITPLDPSAVGYSLLGALKRTLRLPFKLIQPIVPQLQR